MKKIVLIFVSSLFLISCGGDKKKEVNLVDKKADNYALILDVIYEKDDSLSVVYKKDNYYVYDNPTSIYVKGSASIQRITIDLPQAEKIENIAMMASSNKEQESMVIKAISVKKGNEFIVSDKDNFTTFFQFDESFSWDEKSGKYILNHNNKNQPGISGSDSLEVLLTK